MTSSDAVALDAPIDPHFDPDRQPPLPLPEAVAYAETTMRWAQEPLPAEVVHHAVVYYGPHRLQRYEVYAPRGAKAAPVLMFWHGGGWTNGYPEYARFMAPAVVSLGCVLVTPAYRLAPLHPLPAAYEDTLGATAHVLKHASQWGGDPGRLLLAGHSAGGHLAALLALRRRDRQRIGLDDEAILACLPISAILDLHHPAPPQDSLEERVYSKVLGDREQDATLSPLLWCAGNKVRFLLSHGAHDSERVMRSNLRMLRMLVLQPGDATLRCEPGLNHFATHTSLRQVDAPWWQALRALLQTAPGVCV